MTLVTSLPLTINSESGEPLKGNNETDFMLTCRRLRFDVRRQTIAILPWKLSNTSVVRTYRCRAGLTFVNIMFS